MIAEGWVDLKKVEQEVDEEAQAKVQATADELVAERDAVADLLG